MQDTQSKRCPDCVKTFVDELRGIAYNIETSPCYGGGNGKHDIEVLEKIASLFEKMFCKQEVQTEERNAHEEQG